MGWGVKGFCDLDLPREEPSMQVRNLDSHRNASIPREQQELTARCGFEEPPLCLGKA
jgi:hypothetical protein